MDLKLNETQQMIRDSARGLLSNGLDLDAVGELEQTPDGFNADLWTEMSTLGWTSLALPESVGGGGCGLVDLCVLAEELGRAASSTPLTETALCARLLQTVEPSPLASELLGRLASTDAVVVSALTDAGSRNERATPTIELRKPSSADDAPATVSGAKVLVPFASVADVLLVSMATPQGDLVIAAVDGDADGIRCHRHETFGGTPMFRVEFDDVAITHDRVLASGPAARAALQAGLDAATVVATAEVAGTCESMVALAAEYATSRKQFGQPIGRFQAVAHPIADLRMNTDAIGLLAAEAAWTIDQGRDATLQVASTKAFANEVVVEMVHAAHAVHGAIGYTNEYHLQLFTRRARAFCLNHGDTDAQTERAAVALGL